MYQGVFYTSPRRDIKRFTIPVHTGMERLLPSDGIDAIEKWNFGRIWTFWSAIRSTKGSRRKNTHERQTILAGSTVQYLAGTKMRAQPGASIDTKVSIGSSMKVHRKVLVTKCVTTIDLLQGCVRYGCWESQLTGMHGSWDS